MFSHIMVPVDLTHAEKLEKALGVADDLAKLYGARITFVGATSSTPTRLAHSPEEYADRLQAFAAARGAASGVTVASHAVTLPDPTVDLDHALVRASDDLGADAVVVASHIPGIRENFWPSHGGRLASHARASVFVVRPD